MQLYFFLHHDFFTSDFFYFVNIKLKKVKSYSLMNTRNRKIDQKLHFAFIECIKLNTTYLFLDFMS